MGKTKKWENIIWVTKRDNKGIINRDRFYGSQMGARGITNRGNFRDFKSEEIDFKQGQRLHKNWGKEDFKSGQGLQIGAEHPVAWG